MEISGLQVINRQNISSGTNSKEVEGDAFSQILASITGLVEGEDLDAASGLLNLTENLPEQVEEEEEMILFNPVNIPWILMNNQKNLGSGEILGNEEIEQVESIAGAIDSLESGLIKGTEVIGDLNEELQTISGLESDVDNFIPVEVDNKSIEKNSLKEESIFESNTKIQLGQDHNEEITLNVESKSIPKEELSFKEKSLSNDFTKLKEEMASSSPEDNEMKFGAVLEGSTSSKVSANQFNNELTTPRSVDFNENIQAVNETIIELIDLSGNGKDNTMKVKLYPEELGYVDVTLKMEEGKLVARILVENEQVRELFNNHMNQLNDKLARQDIHIERVQIDLNLNSNHHSNSSNGQNSNKNPFESNERMISQKGISEITINEEQINQAYSTNGLNILA